MKRLNLAIWIFTLLSISTYSFAQNGTIIGRVKFVGEIPENPPVVVDKDQEVCGAEPKQSEKLILSADGGIKNVFVSLEGVQGEKLALPAENPTYNQQNCVFTEHVKVIPVGATVDFPNKVDKVMHNLHSYSIKNRPFNKGVPFGGVISMEFTKPEIIKITCDVHKWMVGYLIVHEDPYYSITDENGDYKIENVPPGTYKIQVWQETLGREKQDVAVKAGEETTVNFELKAKESRKKAS